MIKHSKVSFDQKYHPQPGKAGTSKGSHIQNAHNALQLPRAFVQAWQGVRQQSEMPLNPSDQPQAVGSKKLAFKKEPILIYWKQSRQPRTTASHLETGGEEEVRSSPNAAIGSLEAPSLESVEMVVQLEQKSWRQYLDVALKVLCVLVAIGELAEHLIEWIKQLEETFDPHPKSLADLDAANKKDFQECHDLSPACVSTVEACFELFPEAAHTPGVGVDTEKEEAVVQFKQTFNALPPEQRERFVENFLTNVGSNFFEAMPDRQPNLGSHSVQSVPVENHNAPLTSQRMRVFVPFISEDTDISEFLAASKRELLARLAGIIIGGALYSAWQMVRARRASHWHNMDTAEAFAQRRIRLQKSIDTFKRS